MRKTTFAITVALLISCAIEAQPIRRRALLIGINDYSASRIAPRALAASPSRAWSNLDGAVTDAELMRGLLLDRYGFDERDIVMLTDQQATASAIRDALTQHLVAPAREGDVVLFYFSGHGSQVRNTRSSEDDKLDESLVPADSRLGEPDIRDKELRRAFNCILDQKARLTVILDACHSGSGARGLDGGPRHRAISADPRDAADPYEGPRPEDRGALILSATQDFDLAYETIDATGKIRGAFSWALGRAMRDSEDGEAASDTFLRAQARLRAETPSQDPVIAGSPEATLAPFFGVRDTRRKGRALLAIEKMTPAGTYRLRGGWLNGVTVGSELRLASRPDTRLEIVALHGLSSSEARLTGVEGSLPSGALVEIVQWAPPPARPLRVWIPAEPDVALVGAQKMRDEASQEGIRWIDDPTVETPTHQLRRRGEQWELITEGRIHKSGAGITDIPAGASLFLHLPVPAVLADAIGKVEGVTRTKGPETADYILVARLVQDRMEYAWVRPLASAADRRRSVLPLRTAWQKGSALLLRDSVARLRRVHGWQDLASPADRSHYQLAVRNARDGAAVADGVLVGKQRYVLVLRASPRQPPAPVYARYVHVFVIDSHGNGTLLFPAAETGSVENLLPVTPTPGEPVRNPPAEIALAGLPPFEVSAPYGADTFFVLTTSEPLPTLASLEWDGVRTRSSSPRNGIEELLAQTLSGTRGPEASAAVRTPPNWSLEKVRFESVPPRRNTP